MDVVLYFKPAQNSYVKPEKLTGVLEIAQKAHLHVQVIEEAPTPSRIAELKSFWNFKGAIVECGGRKDIINPKSFGETPVVLFNHSFDTLPSTCFAIRHDSRNTGRLAARHLLMCQSSNFAYIPAPGHPFWSNEREKGFGDALALNGKTYRTFSWPSNVTNATERQNQLQAFLRTLPRCCAVFVANDLIAAETITAARMCRISIPDELSVLGVDNSVDICNHTNPSLSSIEPDFRRGGNLAMLTLLAAIKDGSRFKGMRQRTFGDLRVVPRLSTLRLLRQDPVVTKVLDYIRRKACDGLKAGEAARLFPCSRRMADIRFKRAVGHTMLDEIQAVRLERIKELLLNPNQEIKSIADFCGLETPNALRKFFRQETNMTPAEWRQRHLIRISAPLSPRRATSEPSSTGGEKRGEKGHT